MDGNGNHWGGAIHWGRGDALGETKSIEGKGQVLRRGKALGQAKSIGGEGKSIGGRDNHWGGTIHCGRGDALGERQSIGAKGKSLGKK